MHQITLITHEIYPEITLTVNQLHICEMSNSIQLEYENEQAQLLEATTCM
jgi:hypothetical protein